MKNWLQKIKIVFFSTLLLLNILSFLSPAQVFAQIDTTTPATSTLPLYNAGVDKSISDYLCTPTGSGTDLYDCVGRLYRFGISAGAIVLIFLIVFAGYMYITGGEAAKGKAKQYLLSGFTGIAIMLGSYVLLNFINPSLTQIKPIQPPIFNAENLPSCEDIGFSDKCIITTGDNAGQVAGPGSTGTGGGSCTVVQTGNCSVANMQKCAAWNPQEASQICMVESAGGKLDVPSGSDRCQLPDGKIISWSWGLFQFNISAGSAFPEFSECKGVVVPGSCIQRGTTRGGTGYCKLKTCTYGSGGEAAYNRCVAAITKSANSLDRQIKQACNLYTHRSAAHNWCDWESSAVTCKVKPLGFCKS